MAARRWHSSEEVFRLFRSVGRASLLYDIQDSHSGNMAMRWRNEAGEEMVVITATGSQKGDLEPNQLCFLSTAETDFGYYKAFLRNRHSRAYSVAPRCSGLDARSCEGAGHGHARRPAGSQNASALCAG